MPARILAFDSGRPGEARVRMPAVAASVFPSERADWQGDERAVTRFLAGDITGFEQIVRQYSGMVFSVAARFVGPSEAEDVVQDTFLRAYRGLERFRGESSLKTWLFAIALNRARARHGALARIRGLFSQARTGEDGDVLELDPPDSAASPEEATLLKERRSRLRAAVRDLPDEFREAVILRDLEGLSYEEVAQVLEVPIGTVRSRLARGRAQLKEKLS